MQLLNRYKSDKEEMKGKQRKTGDKSDEIMRVEGRND